MVPTVDRSSHGLVGIGVNKLLPSPLLGRLLPSLRGVFLIYLSLIGCLVCLVSPLSAENVDQMTEEEARQIGEQFGIIVDNVDEEIRKELKLQKPEGVVVFEVIGDTPADRAGIKVRAVVKEIDKEEVRNLIDFGRALKRVVKTCNYTVGTFEPADPDNQGVGGIVNFHFVPCLTD